MRRLRAISAIFAAATGLDAKQTATLHRLAGPMLEMHSPALRNQIEERLMIERVQLFEIHNAWINIGLKNNKRFLDSAGNDKTATRDPQSPIRNSVHPLAALRNKDRQFLHHELRFSKRADHMGACGPIPFLRHALADMATPTPDVSAAREIPPIDFGQLILVQPRFAGAVDVVAVIEHKTA